MKKRLNISVVWLAITFVILAGIYLRVKLYLLNLSFWLDEASLGMNIITKGYPEFFRVLEGGQISPPLFMTSSKLLLDATGQAHNIYTRDLVLRFLPLLCSVISLPLFAYAVHKIFRQKYVTLISVAILALNPASINYAQEFKQYGVEPLFTVILILAFWNLRYNNVSVKKLFSYSVLFSVSFWCAYSSLFILPGGYLCTLYDIFKNKYFNIKKLSAFFALPLLSFLLFWVVHYRNVRNVYSVAMEDYWNNTLSSFFTLDNFFSMFLEKTHSIIPFINGKVTFFLLALSLVVFIVKRQKNNLKTMVLTLLPIILCVLASFMHKYPYELRLMLFLLPLFAIILAQFADLLRENRTCDYAISILITIFAIFALKAPIYTYDMHNSLGREFVQIMGSESAKFANTIVYGKVGLWYLASGFQNDENFILGNSACTDKKILSLFNKMPSNEELWIYSSYAPKNCKSKTEAYINGSNDFEVLKLWTNNQSGEYLLKYKKK